VGMAEEVKIPTLANNARMGHPPQTYFTPTSNPLQTHFKTALHPTKKISISD
jgi:hypothetical protein